MLCARPALCLDQLDFPPFAFDILSPDTGKIIGHGRYHLDREAGGAVMHGENRYLSGDYDVEEARMVRTAEPLGAAGPNRGNEDHPLLLVAFRHSFYAANGTPYLEGSLDVKTGLGVCTRTQNGEPSIETAQFNFPNDTYAGASILVPIQEMLRRTNGGGTLRLHAFSCAPGPKLLAIAVIPASKRVTWPPYPGALERIDVTPDFGFWTVLVKPFIPKLAAWFDGSNRWLLVRTQLERYYRGPKIILMRTPEVGAPASADAQKTPPVAGSPPPQR